MTSNNESKLAFIVTQGKTDPVINELFARLDKACLEYATWHSDTIPNSYRRAVEQSAGDILPQVRVLVADRGIPIAELASAIPNLGLVVSIDPALRDTTHINGGTAVRYVDTQPANLISYSLVAQEILDHLRNSSSAESPERALNLNTTL